MYKNLIAILLFIPGIIFSSDISGKIEERLTGQAIDFAVVKLVSTPSDSIKKRTVTDTKGEFFFSGIAPGTFKIEVAKQGYFTNLLFDLKIEPKQNYRIQIDLLKKNKPGYNDRSTFKQAGLYPDGNEYCFMIGGIEVMAYGDPLIPDETATTRKITSGEIEHMQATNLGDVLNLVPGIEKTKNPGLGNSSYAAIRTTSLSGTEGLLESFGSQILVDGIEISNDANALISGRSGIDLRTIPADNIESVEVISGIPSAEHGNFSNGLIKVNTKTGISEPELKAKINPDTKSASYHDGYQIGNGILDYHLNYGYSERDLREKGDEYHRIYGKIDYKRAFLENKLTTNFFATYTRFFDNDEPVGTYKLYSFRRGYQTSGNFSFQYKPQTHKKYHGTISLNLNRRKDHRERFVNDQLRIPADTSVIYQNQELSDTILAGYTAHKKMLGYDWKLQFKGKRIQSFKYGNQNHELIIGIDTKYNTNEGDGLVLNPLFNYYGAHSSRRSYTFRNYSSLQLYSLFFQDNIKGTFFDRKYNLNLGIRYNAFNPENFDLQDGLLKTKHGEFISPRINFRYFVTDNLRFRIGAGESAKSISLAHIYKDPNYFKYINKDSMLVEQSISQQNPDLEAYTSTKYEASVDWQFSDLLGLSLTGYYDKSDNRPAMRYYPIGYKEKQDTITEASYSIYENRAWKDAYGTELVLRTKRIYNLQFRMNCTYRYNLTGFKGTKYDNRADTSIGEKYWYHPEKTRREKIILDYQIDYISQRLGAWLTIDIQQIPYEQKKRIYNTAKYEKEIYGNTYEFRQGMVFWYDNKLFDYSGRWLFNLRLTKSLSQNTEISLYINNLFNNRGLWINPYDNYNRELNPEIYYGIEVSRQW